MQKSIKHRDNDIFGIKERALTPDASSRTIRNFSNKEDFNNNAKPEQTDNFGKKIDTKIRVIIFNLCRTHPLS
jgi:hypothetical protein